jgi:hypothetical protein
MNQDKELCCKRRKASPIAPEPDKSIQADAGDVRYVGPACRPVGCMEMLTYARAFAD